MSEYKKEHNEEHSNEYKHRKISELYQQSCDDTMDTFKLDQQILAAAHAELSEKSSADHGVEQPAKVIKFTGWRRWSAPLATAACLLLAVSLSFNVVFYQQRDTQVPVPAAMQAPIAEIHTTADAVDTRTFQLEKAEVKKQSLSSPVLTAKENRLSKAEADKIFEGLLEDGGAEEVVVTGSSLQKPEPALSAYPEHSFAPGMEQRIDTIIELLKNGQLEQAKRQLALLIEDYPELGRP